MSTEGERLREVAIQQFGSIAEMCRKMGKNPRDLSSYISGRSKIGFRLLEQLASIGIDVEYIKNGANSTVQEATITYAPTQHNIEAMEAMIASLKEYQKFIADLQQEKEKSVKLLEHQIEQLKKEIAILRGELPTNN